jgi:hypothetical protein
MSRRLTIRISDEISEWLEQASHRSGIPAGRIVREQLERAIGEANGKGKPFMKLAGSFMVLGISPRVKGSRAVERQCRHWISPPLSTRGR